MPPAKPGAGEEKKIALAMSGGVDSTVASLLLQDQGYAVQGFFMDLPLADREARLCRVRGVAETLGIALQVVDLRESFQREVIVPFVRGYQAGLTPNPCCGCNRLIKFGALAQAARGLGLNRLATGHYARLRRIDGGNALLRALHPEKDQSYFLAGLTAQQLEYSLFPLGELSKKEVCLRAEEAGFSFRGEESQDVCFLPRGVSLPDFLLAEGLSETEGPIVTLAGRALGHHRGVWRYTIGQRRGLGLPDATPWYVAGLDSRRKQVIVGKEEQLWQGECLLRDPHWIHGQPDLPWQGMVQLRSRHRAAEATLEPFEPKRSDFLRLRFIQPQRAITPGQFAVFYEEARVLGCAVINNVPVHDAHMHDCSR